MINPEYCMSIKCKGSKLQCSAKKKVGEYCGKHAKCKNIINIKDILTVNNVENNVENNDVNDIMINDDNNDIINIKNIELLKINVLKNNCGSYKVFYLRQMIKYHNIPINTKQSKLVLVNELREYFNKNLVYEKNVDKIVVIQKNIRRKLVTRVSNCINNEELMTLESLYEIPYHYFVRVLDINGLYYGFDIRTLNEMFKNGNNKNPYTSNTFHVDECTKLDMYVNYLYKKGINYEVKKDVLDENKSIELRMLDIFHQIDLLDNYTDYNWFKNLNLHQLKNLYRFTEDIWNYRTELSQEEKLKILNNGIAFNIPIHQINKTKHKINLQKIILNEYERFITEGKTRDDKKLGVMLLLTGLVEVSSDAANALPHLVQVF